VNQHRADHNTIGMLADEGCVFGGLNAKTNSNGKIGMSLDTLNCFTNSGARLNLSAGHAGHRDIIDKARSVLKNSWKALVVSSWRGEADKIDASIERWDAKFIVFFRWQIDNDQTINASLFGLNQELFDAEGINGIVIA